MSTDHNLFEEKGEPKSGNMPEALLPTSPTPYRWAKPAHMVGFVWLDLFKKDVVSEEAMARTEIPGG